MIQKGQKVNGAKALILGVTFKENCPDIRNTRVVDIYNELKQYGVLVDVYDPHANDDEVKEELGIDLIHSLGQDYGALILAVAHKEFNELPLNSLIKENYTVVFDTKSFFDRSIVDARL
jgi:UDP-N-acetyl-D-galactosamine dehydrogenase